tara:strand:- start:204 stop:467 length:264 start_codon:yes stop_codon:yes gene_type:complete
MVHLATERTTLFIKYIHMYELFATFCILVNGVPECTTYSDNEKQVYKDLKTCEERAEYRFYETADGFLRYDIPFESIIIGCKGGEES